MTVQGKEVVRLYRALVRLCYSFPQNSTLMIRDIVESSANIMLPYDARGALLIFALAESLGLRSSAHVTTVDGVS